MASTPDAPGNSPGNFNPVVFFAAVAVIALLILFSVVNASLAADSFGAIQAFATHNFGWFLVLVVNVLLGCAGLMAFTRMGEVRLGGREARPEYSRLTWFAMLFSAGMGIGLLFYGVAEPVLHFSNPPLTAFSNPEAAAQQGLLRNAQHAMGLTFLHWGLHAWGIYAVIGLGLAYVGYNRKMGLSIGAFLKAAYPRIPDLFVDVIDVLAITATVCGVAASLGFGASQINAGLGLLAGVPDNNLSRSIVIFIITMLATISVALGLDKGIRRLSEVNMVLAIGLALFVLIAGPTVFLLDSYVQNIGYYLQRFVYFSTWTEAYSAADWQSSWTIFYWAWWISWSPFVGIFIARISYGRTVREFIGGVLLVPTLFTFAWMTIFGDSALYIELFAAGGLSDAVNQSMPDALFAFLHHYPMSQIVSGVAVIIVATFFVTSADSGALVTAMIASGGNHHAGFAPRVTWAVAMGALAGSLLWSGGFGALQTAAIVTGLPFALVLLVLAIGLLKMLRSDVASGHGPGPDEP